MKYITIKRGNIYSVCKVLNIYKKKKIALDNMIDLLLRRKSEEDIEKGLHFSMKKDNIEQKGDD